MLVVAMLLAVFLLLRLVNLTLVPIFADEAIYIRWAQLIGERWRYFFIPLSDGKTPLFMWVLAPLLKLGVDPLITGRLLAVAAGLGTISGIYLLTKKLFDRPTAVWAAGLSLIQPFLVFYDRLSLVDSLLTALIVWSAYLIRQLFSRPNLTRAVVLGLAWAAALLTKPSAGLYLALTGSFFLLKPKLDRLKWLVPAGILALSFYNLQRLSGAFHLIGSRTADYLQAPHFSSDTLRLFLGWLINYFSLLGLLIFVAALIWALYRRQLKPWLLSLLVLVPFVVTLLVGKIVYPRYFLPLIPFMLIIAAWGLRQWRILGMILMVVLAVGWLKFDYQLLTMPRTASLPLAEKSQYFYDWSAGYGLKEIRDYLRSLPTDQKVVVATEGSFGTLPNGLEIYFQDSTHIQILGAGFPKTTVSEGMQGALNEGKRVFLVANWQRYNLTDINRLRLLGEYPRPALSEVEREKLMFYEVY